MIPDFLSAYKDIFNDYTELRAQTNTSRQVAILGGNMTANTQLSESGVSARVYKGGTFGFASGSEYTKDTVKNVLSAATDNAVFMDKHVKRGMPPLPQAASGKQEIIKELGPIGLIQEFSVINYRPVGKSKTIEYYVAREYIPEQTKKID